MRRSKHPFYSDLSRKKRGDLYIRAKNDIRGHSPLFTTHDYLGPEARSSWADFVFLSRKGKIVYSGYIRTCQDALVEDAENRFAAEFADKFLDLAWRGGGRHPMDFNVLGEKREELGGLSLNEWQNGKINVWLAGRPPVFEEYEIDRTYLYAIGVHMAVDEEIITKDVIAKHVNRFLDMGEAAWKAEEPVNPEKLVYSLDWREKLGISAANVVAGLDGKPL